MTETVKMFDYWAIHDDWSVQFFQITEGEVTKYREYDCIDDAPIVLIDERSFNPTYIGPIRRLRYHGQSYIAPVHDGQPHDN